MILRVITVLAVFTVADGLLPLLMANCKYEHKGCFKDTKNRAIDSIGGKKEFHRSVLVEQCRQLAMRLRHSLFGAESEDECFTGHIDYKENKQYDRYGPKTSCAKDGTGGGWAIDVYKITCEDLVKTWLTNGWKVPTLNSRKEIDLADQALQLRMSNPRIENARIQIRFLDADGNSPGADEHVGVINFYITKHVITFGGYCGEIVLPKRSPETKFKGSYRWGDLIEIKVTGDGMEVSAAGIIQVVDSCKDLTDALKNIATFTFEYYDKEEMDAWH